MVLISDVLREAASKTQEKWEDEPFPEEDKKILRKHVKSFVGFIKGLKG